MLSSFSKSNHSIWAKMKVSSANAFNLDKTKTSVILWRVNSLPHSPEFNQPWRRKHFGEKEKMLVTSIFSFFQNVFYPSKNKHYFYTPPAKWRFLGVYWNQPVCPSVCPFVCVQNTSFCQSHGGDINSFPNNPWFLCVIRTSLENTVGTVEIARNEQFLLSHYVFYPFR